MNRFSERYDELWRQTTAIYEGWAKKQQISYHDLLVILSISQSKKPCTQKLICEQWTFPKQTTHSILQSFVKKGWIVFIPMESDRRKKEIVFTEKGSQFAEKIINDLEEREKRVWDKLGIERSKALLENTALYNQYFMEEEDLESV